MLRILSLLPLAALLTGCKAVLLSPSGDIALQQRDLIYISVALMLLVIIPVMILTVFFAWKYRASNAKVEADYDPDWDHSVKVELFVWAGPLLIIIALGAITWVSTHKLDPYRPLDRIAANQPVPEGVEPLIVEAVSLDWKWLFLYPQYGIATVNEMAAPVDRPITFHLTSSSVMNSFFIPALAGQVYTMAGMQTKLHAVINRPGTFKGFSANYSGEGFSGMHFEFLGVDDAGFDEWVERVRQSPQELSRLAYLKLEAPSQRNPVTYFGDVDPGLYDAILNRCVEPNRMCMSDMMAIDQAGGLGLPGLVNMAKIDTPMRADLGLVHAPDRTYVSAMCTINDPEFGFVPPMNAL